MQQGELILSIDGGASSSKAGVIEKNTKKLIREYIGKSISSENTNIQESILHLKDLLVEIKKDFKIFFGIVVGVAGLDSEKEKVIYEKAIKRLVKIYFKSVNVKVVNDIELLISQQKNSSSNGYKTILIAGTGVNCVLSEGGDLVAKSGGLGKVLADQGGGYYIGKKALEESVKSHDFRGEKTILEQEVLKFFDVKNFSALKDHLKQLDYQKQEIAKLAPLVVKNAEGGDKVSLKILQKSVEELLLHVIGVSKKANTKEFSLALYGSIFEIKIVKNTFEKYISKYFPKVTIIQNTEKTFVGGVNMF